jgi:hypothetical protein
MTEKFFNPKELNQQLPQIRRIVEDILSKAKEARLLMAAPATHGREGQLIELDRSIKALMTQLEEMGCYYKDWNFEIGLVDFPAITHGQEVLLCWRSDEPQVAWFHGFQDGYAGRRPITKDLIFS